MLFSDLQKNFLFFTRNFSDKALIPFIGVRGRLPSGQRQFVAWRAYEGYGRPSVASAMDGAEATGLLCRVRKTAVSLAVFRRGVMQLTSGMGANGIYAVFATFFPTD